MQSGCDQDFKLVSQQYLKRKAERREAQQRFFEKNLNEREIYKMEEQKRKQTGTWNWAVGEEPPNASGLQIEDARPQQPDQKEATEESQNGAHKQEEQLRKLLIGEADRRGQSEDAKKLQIVEPEVILGKIEGYLDFILKCSQSNYTGKKKHSKSKGEKRSGKSGRKSKKKDKRPELASQSVKKEENTPDQAKMEKLGGGEILKIGDLLKSTNS